MANLMQFESVSRRMEMDTSKREDLLPYDQVLDPDSRLKVVTRYGNTVEIDVNIPPRRYFRSGLEMVRMANAYLEEGSLENAFILYLKFMTLFLEKIRTHPEFDSVPADIRAINSQKLREVLPKAESLKKKLLDQYRKEYDRFIKDSKQREELAKERKRALEEQAKLRLEKLKAAEVACNDLCSLPSAHPLTLFGGGTSDHPRINTNVIPVQPLLDKLSYPSEALATAGATVSDLPASRLTIPSLPGPGVVDRSTKPASLLSPSANMRHGLRMVIVPGNLMQKFLFLAQRNTDRNIETCGILAGQLRHDQLVITHLLVPEQIGTCDSCTTQREEDLFDFQDQHDLITFGWIHTHPTQTSFLSSVDLHTHCAYQRMMPEAIAIVCAPRYSENSFFCLTPNYGLDFIANCQQTGFHPHPTEPELFMVAEHYKIDPGSSIYVVDLRK